MPCALVEVIESIPAIVLNWRSRGVATEEAIVSGLPPGRLAVICRVGKSTFGRSETGSPRKAKRPNPRIPSMTRVVMTGRRMNGSEMLMRYPLSHRAEVHFRRRRLRRGIIRAGFPRPVGTRRADRLGVDLRSR